MLSHTRPTLSRRPCPLLGSQRSSSVSVRAVIAPTEPFNAGAVAGGARRLVTPEDRNTLCVALDPLLLLRRSIFWPFSAEAQVCIDTVSNSLGINCDFDEKFRK